MLKLSLSLSLFAVTLSTVAVIRTAPSPPPDLADAYPKEVASFASLTAQVRSHEKQIADLKASDLDTRKVMCGQLGRELLALNGCMPSDALKLLAIAHNNNWRAYKDGAKRDMVYLGPKWTIDRLPVWLEPDDEQRQFINKHLADGVTPWPKRVE